MLEGRYLQAVTGPRFERDHALRPPHERGGAREGRTTHGVLVRVAILPMCFHLLLFLGCSEGALAADGAGSDASGGELDCLGAEAGGGRIRVMRRSKCIKQLCRILCEKVHH